MTDSISELSNVIFQNLEPCERVPYNEKNETIISWVYVIPRFFTVVPFRIYVILT
jgi:hypothetical protein